jgi:hypothetical protein
MHYTFYLLPDLLVNCFMTMNARSHAAQVEASHDAQTEYITLNCCNQRVSGVVSICWCAIPQIAGCGMH